MLAGRVTEYLLEGTPVTLALSPDLKVAASGLSDGTINFRYLNSQQAFADEWLRRQGARDSVERQQPLPGHRIDRRHRHRRLGFRRSWPRGE